MSFKRILYIICVFLMVPMLCMAQTQYAKPRRGEGITTFLQRYGRTGQEYYNAFLELNKKRLGGRTDLLLDVSYALPPLKTKKQNHGTAKPEKEPIYAATSQRGQTDGKTIYEPLFGEKYAKVKLKSSRLKGACIYLVCGHGGPDPGAIGKVGKHAMHEDEYAYDVVLRLAYGLMQEGAKVRIIIQDSKDGIRDGEYLKNSKRETCNGKIIPLNQVARLQQRSDEINRFYEKDKNSYSYCRSIFIHLDSRSTRAQTDVFFYHSPGSALGSRLAQSMRSTFKQKYDKHQPNRGFEGTVGGRQLYVLSHTHPVGVFVELGNIQNAQDQKRFIISANRQALANWLLDGFALDFEKSKPKVKPKKAR